MPLERGFPRFIPRFFGTKLKIIIGPSITSKVQPLIDSYHSKLSSGRSSASAVTTGVIVDINGNKTRPKPPYYEGDPEDLKRIRIEIAALLKGEVEALGRMSRREQRAEGLKEGHENVNLDKEIVES